MTYGEKLRLLRIKSGLNQTELANKLGISQQTYNRYELEKREPDFEIIKVFANFFNVSVDYILCKTNDENISIIEKEVLPIELRNLGIDYIETIKEAKESGLTASEISELIKLAKKIKG